MITCKPHIIFSIFILLLMFVHINSVVAHNSQNCTKERFYTPKRLYKSFQVVPLSSQQTQHSSENFDLASSDSNQEDQNQDSSSDTSLCLLEESSYWLGKSILTGITTGYFLNYYGVEQKRFTPPPRL